MEFVGGDQDWITLIGWEVEEIIHKIPCQFDRHVLTPVNHELACYDTKQEFLLAPMGALAPGSVHARPSAQAPIDTSGNFFGASV
jgi:hypothetical protein